MANTTPGSASNTRAIVLTGLLAGTLDITAAIVKFFVDGGTDPTKIFRYIASGVLGRDALKGGWGMAAAGLLFHYLIAFIFTIFFFWAYPRLGLQKLNKVVVGLVYGILVWIVMNKIVVPLSNTPKPAVQPPFNMQALIQMLILMFCIGLPIALMANKHYLYRK